MRPSRQSDRPKAVNQVVEVIPRFGDHRSGSRLRQTRERVTFARSELGKRAFAVRENEAQGQGRTNLVAVRGKIEVGLGRVVPSAQGERSLLGLDIEFDLRTAPKGPVPEHGIAQDRRLDRATGR